MDVPRLLVCGAIILQATLGLAAEDPFQAGVRPTPPLSPEEERQAFRLPPGFEIQLVASEPDILKPMNMAFDDDGRLWVSMSQEYPYAAPPDREGRDCIKVLEDTDGDGKADRITTFADGLNIPIGLYPVADGVIAFSIPHIWHFRDTDGDGVADERVRLYGPFGYDRDTHGMNNAFRRSFDGWFHACHGFNNVTTVSGSDGRTVHMQSGNTYRFRPDGSHIEQFTWGQVNPFGIAIDPLGNLFTADCHSKPIYELLRGGYYPSFGKPHDGLGFVPPTMDHDHGSTAISGIVYYTGENFPPEYRANIFTGNVMTSRVNRDTLEQRGSTPIAHEEPDFVVAGDPWFRPVDLQVGPDGALYIADFYNRIIGHYEVPLEHPGRDRTSGRIWRIVYTGDDSAARPAERPRGLSSATTEELIAALDEAPLERRLRATHLLVDRANGKTAELLHREYRRRSSRARSHLLWALFRLGALQDELLAVAAGESDRDVRVHAAKILAEMPKWSRAHRNLALAGLGDSDPFVSRAAADAFGRHPQFDNVRPLLDALAATPEADTHLRYVLRKALRDQLRADASFQRLLAAELSASDAATVAGVALAIESAPAASFLLHYVSQNSVERSELAQYIQHAARFIPETETDNLVALVRERLGDDLPFQLELLGAVQRGLAQRGASAGTSLVAWGEDLTGRLLDALGDAPQPWMNQPLVSAANADNPWILQQRPSADGNVDSIFVCSLPRGEALTGALCSRWFEIPARLTFYVAGHDGFPDKPAAGKNQVRLIDAEAGEVLASTAAPRNDLAQPVQWNLAEFAGRQGRIEIVDADDGGAYAWIAAGRFEPPVVPLPTISPGEVSERWQAVAGAIGSLQLKSLEPRLETLLTGGMVEGPARAALAAALVALRFDNRLAAIAPFAGDPAIAGELRDRVALVIVSRDPELLGKVLIDIVQAAPERKQLTLAETLAGDRSGAEELLRLVAAGHASPRLLQRTSVREKLLALRDEALMARADELTSALPDENEIIRKLIAERVAAHRGAARSAANGSAVFAKHCANCHQLDGKGPLIGPQLDGIGNRGMERLVEDVLDPNRNVDVAFCVSTLVLDSGKVLAGLIRREEGATLVLADNKGQELSIPLDEIDERTKTRLSLMPENVAELVSEQEFHDLIAFLLTKTAKPAGDEAQEP